MSDNPACSDDPNNLAKNPGESAASSAIRVAIIEDRDEIREGLRQLLDGSPSFQCVGAYGSMEVAFDGISTLLKHHERAVTVVLIDLGLPGMSGIDGILLLHDSFPSLPLMVLSVFEDDQRIFEAICAGASGYLLKNTQPERLLASLREVVDGGAPMSPEVARRVIEIFRTGGLPHRHKSNLTPHESRVLKLLVNGHNYRTAAADLGVSIHAISYHVRHIYTKLQVHSKSEAVVKALRDKLV